MTSLFDIIDYDEQNSTRNLRQASVVAKLRADKAYGTFIASTGVDSALEYLETDFRVLAANVTNEYGGDPEIVYNTLVAEYRQANNSIINIGGKDTSVTARTASVIHEARKPKMCNFHSDVVDISLADGQARSGFDAMAQHWGGPKHCKGDGYEGGKCNFKPAMVTQAFWDEKAEKAQERKDQRSEQATGEEWSEQNDPQNEEPEGVTEEVTPEAQEAPESVDLGESAEVIDFPSQSAPEAVSEAPADIPMSMAASTRWKVADSDNLGGNGTPDTKMDKSHNVPGVPDTEGADSPNPTKRKDIVAPIKAENAQKVDEIGEQVTEHQDVAKDTGDIKGEGTGTFKGGPSTAVSSLKDDVDKNPLTALMQGEFDGFVPQNTVQQAITAHRRR